MAATREDVERWIATAREKGATHVISVCDTFDHDDYPVYVMPGESLAEKKALYDGVNMQRINEVIEVKQDEPYDEQMAKELATQCIADIRKHRQEIEASTTVLVRLRRKCRHKYAYVGFDSAHFYAQCDICRDNVQWEHGISGFALPRLNRPEPGEPITPPEGRFHSVPGPENYMH